MSRWFRVLVTVAVLQGCHCPNPPAPADDSAPAVRIIGRSLSEPQGIRIAWGATTLVARFTGTEVGIKLQELDPNTRGNVYNVWVDDHAPLVLATRPGVDHYPVATDLPAGEHTITIVRRTEALVGEARFGGLTLSADGHLLSPPPAKTRHLEIIGDSISAGYGNEGANEHCGFSPATENGDLAYGPMTARNVDAEVMVLAWSGRGVQRNNDKTTVGTVPELYARVLPEQPNSLWDFRRWQADAVVINLGTNDFAPGVPDHGAFVAAYQGLVEQVRQHYPHAYIFCSLGPLLSDAYPKGQKQLSTARAWIQEVVDQRNHGGDSRVTMLEFPMQTGHRGYGCQWHPSLATHAAMAAQLSAALRARLGW